MNLSLFTDFLSFIKIQHWVAVKHSHHIILGDLYEVTDLSKYTKMTSLTLISQCLQSIDIIIENIPIKENITFLCLNENLIMVELLYDYFSFLLL
jgi:hypothetical protein